MAVTRRSALPPQVRPRRVRSRGEAARASWATSHEAGRSFRSDLAHARPHARTRPRGGGGGGVLVVPAPSSLSPRAVSARGPTAARTRAARGGDAPRRYARRIAHASSARRARTSGRTWGWCFPASVPRRTALPARRAITERSGRTQTLRLSTQNALFSPLSVPIGKTMSGHEKRGGSSSGVGPLRQTGTTLRGHATGRPGSPAPAGWQLPARPPSRPRTTRRLAPW